MAVTITLGATGVTNVGKGGDAAGDKFVNFENITGGLAADVLTGNADANLLTGGSGNDVLTGGLGADRFQFNATTHGVDVIKDFVFGTDTIGLDGDAFGVPLTGSAQSLGINFVHGSVPTGPGFTLLYDATGHLLWDIDGTGAAPAVVLAELLGHPTLTASDIFFT